MHKLLVLIGMPGVGKSTLAKRLHDEDEAMLWKDLDLYMEQMHVGANGSLRDMAATAPPQLFLHEEQRYKTLMLARIRKELEDARSLHQDVNIVVSLSGSTTLHRDELGHLSSIGRTTGSTACGTQPDATIMILWLNWESHKVDVLRDPNNWKKHLVMDGILGTASQGTYESLLQLRNTMYESTPFVDECTSYDEALEKAQSFFSNDNDDTLTKSAARQQ